MCSDLFARFLFLVINMVYVWTEHVCVLYLIRYMTTNKEKSHSDNFFL